MTRRWTDDQRLRALEYVENDRPIFFGTNGVRNRIVNDEGHV